MRRRRREPRYRNGDCSLGWRAKDAVAEYNDAETGKRQRVRLGVSRREGEKKAREALDAFVETRKAVVRHNDAPKVGELWTDWLADRAADGFSNRNQKIYWVFLGPHFAHRDPLLLTLEDCREYARARFDKGVSQWGVHNELRVMRALMKWAFDNNRLPRRPRVWVPRPGEHRNRVLTYTEASALVAAALSGDPHIGLFVRIAFATAARHGAILDLTWDRVDFAANTIEFEEGQPRDPMSKAWRKGRAKVFMGEALKAALLEAKKGRRCDHVIEHGGHRLVTVKNGFFNAVQRAGLAWQAPHPKDPERQIWKTDVTPHVIRHTVLTWLDQGGIETKRAAQLAGHKDERTTRLVYTHTDPTVLREAVELLDERLLAKPVVTPEPSEGEDGSDAP